ncbi:MAG: hypothetical protein GY913_17120 [Proteobacteria bacterium]|nr:hypothetical protein [Pseudomonadota bacterium]MCP4918627.1 hypothetical protein [Pseudomonadota bacterium]
MILLLAAACGEPDEVTTVSLEDAQNYTFDGGLDIASFEVRELTDLTIDWSGLDTDLQLHEMDPSADIDMLTLLAFRYLTEAEVMDALSNNALLQSDIALFVTNETGGATDTTLSEFTLLGNDIDVELEFRSEDIESWLLISQSGTTPGVGSRMLKFLAPSPDSDVTHVDLTNDDTTLEFTVDVASADAISVPGGTSALDMDWSAVRTDSLGNDFEFGGIDKIMVARYDLDVAGLEESFLDIEFLGDPIYETELNGQDHFDLATLEGFEGFDDTGTWVVALRCGTCTHPAPPFLGIVDVQ